MDALLYTSQKVFRCAHLWKIEMAPPMVLMYPISRTTFFSSTTQAL